VRRPVVRVPFYADARTSQRAMIIRDGHFFIWRALGKNMRAFEKCSRGFWKTMRTPRKTATASGESPPALEKTTRGF